MSPSEGSESESDTSSMRACDMVGGCGGGEFEVWLEVWTTWGSMVGLSDGYLRLGSEVWSRIVRSSHTVDHLDQNLVKQRYQTIIFSEKIFTCRRKCVWYYSSRFKSDRRST